MKRHQERMPQTPEELDHYIHVKMGFTPPAQPQEELQYSVNVIRIVAAWDALRTLLARYDGWLRVVPNYDEGKCYWKWKYTNGPFDNHYVMYVGDLADHTTAIQELLRKVIECDRGVHLPTKDRYFGR